MTRPSNGSSPGRRTTGLVIAAALAAGGLGATGGVLPAAAAPALPTATTAHPGAQGDDYFIGANYFGGWKSGDNFHFEYLDGRDWRPDHPELEPKYGWYEDSQELMDAQIVDAAANGLDYFVFDWYPERPTIPDGGDLGGLHLAMDYFRTSAENPRMQYMVNYINGGSFNLWALRTPGMTQAQFEVARDAEWDTLTTRWVELFQDPSYVKIDGKPAIEIYDVQRITSDFSTGAHPEWSPHDLAKDPAERAGLTAAIQVLVDKAQAAGFPDVLIGGGLQQPGFEGEYVSAHDYDGLYDFFAAYAWHDMRRVPDADNNYYNLIRDNHDYVWDYYARFKNPEVDYLPVLSQGWDNIVHPEYNKWTIDKTPEAFGDYLRELKAYLDVHPQTNLSSTGSTKMAVIGAWNELFEGHYFLPTKADGDAYTSQVGRVFGSNSPDAAVTARQANTADALAAVRAEVAALRAGGDLGKKEKLQLKLVDLAATGVERVLGGSLPTRAALALTAPLVRTMTSLGVRSGVGQPAADDLSFAFASLVEAANGLTVTTSADDYSPTVGQEVSVGVDVTAAGSAAGGDAAPIGDVSWTVRFPDTWPAGDLALTGASAEATVPVPAGLGDGTLYNVSDMFAGPGTTTGNLQRIEVDYAYTVGGVRIEGTRPLALTVVPDLTWRIIETRRHDEGVDQSVWLHNVTREPITGTLAIATVPGVTVSAYPDTVTIAPDERLEIPVTFQNTGAADASVPVTFTVGDTVNELGAATVAPREVAVVTTPVLDGALRSDGLVELANANGRLQVGTVKRQVGGTEYRDVLSFPLAALAGEDVSHVVLDLTEFEANNPPAVVLDHLAPAGAITIGQYDQAALGTVPFEIPGLPNPAGTHRRVDITEWVQADLAAGASHTTVRIRFAAPDVGVTAYRVFRPAEYTPGDAGDAPQLRVRFTAE